ncbi:MULTISPECIES: Na/Pi cotransporter family protein [unclassified Lysinibacillus]|uniref:Na/Pi cotransporter family protein n=1 Tax=unclassified Lysinibacillus TaxID=2636778 RepID=UPI002011BCDC|nr:MULTISPECIES: Na/Pi cotransporter family protein [unclassified Lysinibacillus]MCL1695929.1 Na/Pi cotransporter family protein [Lysinibacillus sp. BPa_S21]MCL1700892.1 Na/Pi cotransporter family protein [Lysinibacillus sp. Bpr_S20]
MTIDWQSILFQFLGGLGVFLFSIKFMGDGLQKSADDRLREWLNRFTTNPLMGVLVGIIVTICIQSSSATTVITVGLVSAGFLTLRQAIGVIMGANIGTTITSFIIGIDIGIYFYPLLAIGAGLLFFFKKATYQYIGQILFGFGGLFLGLELMSASMQSLHQLADFATLTLHLSNLPILGIFLGTVFTLLVQSSTATVGVLQGLYAEHLIGLENALPILFGENIGTTITAVLASLGASIYAKRAAAAHVLFNIIGTIIFMLFFTPFMHYVQWISGLFHLEAKMQIALAHGSFNLINMMIQLPFIGGLAVLVTKLVPGHDGNIDVTTKHLDPSFIDSSPAIALGQAKEEVLRMGEHALHGLEETFLYMKTGEAAHVPTVLQLEVALDHLDKEITNYLVMVSKQPLSRADSVRHHTLLTNVRDIERIGDHFENILELLQYKDHHEVSLSKSARQDLIGMFSLAIEAVRKSIAALDTASLSLAQEVTELESLIDDMEDKLRQKHIARLNTSECNGAAGIVYTDIVSNLERIGDHAVNIADSILGIRQ